MDIASIIDIIPFKTILAGLLFLIYWVQAFFIIYHLIRFGIGPKPKIIALVFFVGSIFLTMVVFVVLGQFAFDFSGAGFNFSLPNITNIK
jgi:hypothetical protein